MTEVKRNRTLASDLRWLLEVAQGVEARIELEQYRSKNLRTNTPIVRVRAMFMHDKDGPALVGRGKDATEAVRELRDAIEMEVARRERQPRVA